MAKRQEVTKNPRITNDPRVDKIWEVMKEKKLNIMKLQKETKKQGASVSYVHLNKVLNGIKPLSYDILEKIARALKYPTEYFFDTKVYTHNKPKRLGGKKLMSEILTNVVGVMRYVQDDVDVSKLRDFFTKNETKPLIATGHGGKFAPAVYAALLYSTYQSLGRAVTCYSCNSLSDATIKNSKILLVSKGIANIDKSLKTSLILSISTSSLVTVSSPFLASFSICRFSIKLLQRTITLFPS